MSSSNHPTSNIKEVFSTNLPKYIPDYFPASPGKTYSSASNDSTDVIPPAILTLSTVVSSSLSIYTPTPPPIYDIRGASIKMHIRHHQNQLKDILYYLEELSYHRSEKMKERFINDRIIISGEFDELKTKLTKVCSQLSRLQRKRLGQRDLISFTRFRITTLEQIIKEIRARQQTDQEDL
ncbi:hypothetical protein Tco_0581053 [Tanacetum coccineum]